VLAKLPVAGKSPRLVKLVDGRIIREVNVFLAIVQQLGRFVAGEIRLHQDQVSPPARASRSAVGRILDLRDQIMTLRQAVLRGVGHEAVKRQRLDLAGDRLIALARLENPHAMLGGRHADQLEEVDE
jgi:hypothetical protein